MDPLSVTASTIAIVGVSVQAARCIAKLKAVKELPGEFRLLLCEVLNLHEVLSECCLVNQQHGSDSSGPEREQSKSSQKPSTLLGQVQRAGSKLEELENSILAKIGHAARGGELKALWAGLLHGKQSLQKLRAELKDIRMALSFAIGASTSSAVARIESTIQDVSSAQTQLLQLQSVLLKEVRLNQDRPPAYTDTTNKVSLESAVHAADDPNMTRKLPKLGIQHTESTNTSTSVAKAIQKPASSQKYCAAWCSCQCHKRQSLKTAKLVQNVFGTLSVSWSGIPKLAKTCDQHACRRRSDPTLSVTYRFPQALVQRVMCLSMSYASMCGPELRVRLPRVVDWTSPVWRPAIDGDVTTMRALFEKGEASPWDVNPIGGSILHYSADHFNADICRLLLDNGVDPTIEDDFRNSPVVIAWDHILSGNTSAEDTYTVTSLFKDTDYLSTRQFTVLHKIVLGLVSKDLALELQCSTSTINTPDSRGRTPLSWAAARGDTTSVRTLLTHGANANLPDDEGNSPLHYVKNESCAQILLDYKADVVARNRQGATPLYALCNGSGDIALLTLFLSAGADADMPNHEGQTPLHCAALKSHTSCVEALTSQGADINARNTSGDSPLRFALMFNAHDALRVMLATPAGSPQRADFGGINAYGHTFAHSIARTANLETVTVLLAAKTDSLRLDEEVMDLEGKTCREYFAERMALLSGDSKELENAFSQLVRKVQDADRVDDAGFGAESAIGELEADVEEKLQITIEAVELVTEEGMGNRLVESA